MAKKKKSKWLLYLVHEILRIFVVVTGLVWYRPKRKYVSKEAKKKIKGGALVIANHSTFLDPVYMLQTIWYRRQHFVATKVLFKNKFKTFLFRLFLCIPIDKENFSLDSFREIEDCLREDEIVTIFPEGGINVQEGIAAFKSGVVLLALRTNKPIVPVYIKPRKHFFSRLRVYIGEPITLNGGMPSLKEINRVTKTVYEKELELEQIALAEESHDKGN